MLIRMRTTLVLDDHLLRQAKRRAAELGVTVSDIVNAALRDSLARAPVAAPPFSMVKYGDAGMPVEHEPFDFTAIEEVEDRTRLR